MLISTLLELDIKTSMSVLDSVIIIIVINLSIYLNVKHVDINEQVHLFTVLPLKE